MIRKLILTGALALITGAAAIAGSYKVLVQLPEGAEVTSAVLTNYDNGDKVDSVAVANNQALFNGDIDTPIAVRLYLDGSVYAQFILEAGEIAIDTERNATGSPLNESLEAANRDLGAIADEYRATTDASLQEGIYYNYLKKVQDIITANGNNPIGLIFFMDLAQELSPEELNVYLEEYPAFKNSKRIGKLIEMNNRKAATSVGQKYIDFDINGKKLSDYVGRDGHYLLVDFWASWCGPCIRQTKVIKELYNQYKDSGLDVLGVAVWDKPEDTLRAIEQHQLPWECIIDAQTIPTELYGISGIPCIILISPDGTILSRDKQSDELKADVAKYLEQ